MQHDNNQPMPDRQAIAEQVIVSAGDVLVAAGFTREEIGQFFRQAADLLAPLSPVPEGAAPLDAPSPASARLDAFHSAFRQSKPITELRTLIALAGPLLPLDREGPQLKAAFDLAMQMTPLLAEAQNGLRTVAEEAGLALYPSRDDWMVSLDTKDLSNAEPAICLEDFEPAYAGAFEAIAAVLDELLRREDSEAFTYLLGHMAENGLVIDRLLRSSIEKGMRLLPV